MLVTLVSGGLDSTLIAVLAKENGIIQHPLFIDYGQICMEKEWDACQRVHSIFGLPEPQKMNLSGYGKLIESGLTSLNLDVNVDAFLPGRNLLFLLVGCAYAYQINVNAVAIGLLNENNKLFPDQSGQFIQATADLINIAMNRKIQILTPLMHLNKAEVMEIAREKGIAGTYSCHRGSNTPCGICVSCLETLASKEGS